jgi:catechol 2,3-dioxygenase-like lactoylglutathione lyase family enzyme
MSTPITQGVHHLGLTVSDLEAARDFFVKALRFKLLGESADYPAAFVSDDSTTITLWAADQNAAQFDRRCNIGLHHAAFKVRSADALKSLYVDLSEWPDSELEGEISAPSKGSAARHFFIRMPGGPRIEFWTSGEE